MTRDGRGLARRHLIFYLEVYDYDTGALLGHLVDITTKGIKLVSREKIEPGQRFRMRMVLPEDYFSQGSLHFQGESLWSGNAINPDFFDTGFAVSGLTPEGTRVVEELVSLVGFND